MGGGLMQLVAYGAQDIYLTGNPQITFFKVVYRRHTNFSMELIQQTINGTTSIGTSSGNGTVTISRNGDLVSNMHVRCATDSTNGIQGDKLINEVEIEIGGQRIDKHTREWLQVWAELSTPDSKSSAYKYVTGGWGDENYFQRSRATDTTPTVTNKRLTGQQVVIVPLQFWFCRNAGLALPLIALQYHEVKLKFKWGTSAEVGRGGSTTSTPGLSVWANYIYLDTDERRRFAQVSHEYLIEQLQYQSEGTSKSSFKLNFNHPVKELIWTDASSITTQKCKLELNGHDRFSLQEREYFQIEQPMNYHTSVPGFNIKETDHPVMLSEPILITGGTNNAVASDSPAFVGDGNFSVRATTQNNLQIFADTENDLKNKLFEGDIVNITYPINAVDVSPGTAGVTLDQYYDSITLNAVVEDVCSPPGANTRAGYTLAFEAGTGTANTPPAAFTTPTASNVSTGPGSVTVVGRHRNAASKCSSLAREVNVYSFALKPEEHQPSGTCNFSRIDTAKLIFSTAAQVENIYAVNYNVLRIMSGMGGLAYSN